MNKSHAAAAVISIQRLTLSYHLMPAILSARDLKFEYARDDGNQQNHVREGNHQFADGIYIVGGKNGIRHNSFCREKINKMIHHGIALAAGEKQRCSRTKRTDDYGGKSCFTNSRKQHGEGHDRKYYNVVDDGAV